MFMSPQWGDAKSLSGGILLQTPLLAGNGKMYGVAQGPLVLGGFSAGTGGGGGASVQKNHPTVAIVPDGGKVVSEVGGNIVEDESLELLLKEPDFTSIARLTEAINAAFTNSCESIDSTTVRVKIPKEYLSHPIDFLSRLEALEVTPDTVARVVVNERTGTIVANSLIRIGPCAGLARQPEHQHRIQPGCLAARPPQSGRGDSGDSSHGHHGGRDQEFPHHLAGDADHREGGPPPSTLWGVSPRDMISILMHMKKVGALQAELRVN
jgi:flagellar P-ring protein precursor FlgI